MFLESYLHEVTKSQAASAELVGQGALYAPFPKQCIFADREIGDVLQWYTGVASSLARVERLNGRDPEVVAGLALEFGAWISDFGRSSRTPTARSWHDRFFRRLAAMARAASPA